VYWKQIVSFFNQASNDRFRAIRLTVKQYPEFYGAKLLEEDFYKYMVNAERWNANLKKDATFQTQPPGRAPVYGRKVEADLAAQVHSRSNEGMPINQFIVRRLLLQHLKNTDQERLLKTNGGGNTFTSSWASNFFNRNGLRSYNKNAGASC
jgi:hypothetical protein